MLLPTDALVYARLLLAQSVDALKRDYRKAQTQCATPNSTNQTSSQRGSWWFDVAHASACVMPVRRACSGSVQRACTTWNGSLTRRGGRAKKGGCTWCTGRASPSPRRRGSPSPAFWTRTSSMRTRSPAKPEVRDPCPAAPSDAPSRAPSSLSSLPHCLLHCPLHCPPPAARALYPPLQGVFRTPKRVGTPPRPPPLQTHGTVTGRKRNVPLGKSGRGIFGTLIGTVKWCTGLSSSSACGLECLLQKLLTFCTCLRVASCEAVQAPQAG